MSLRYCETVQHKETDTNFLRQCPTELNVGHLEIEQKCSLGRTVGRKVFVSCNFKKFFLI